MVLTSIISDDSTADINWVWENCLKSIKNEHPRDVFLNQYVNEIENITYKDGELIIYCPSKEGKEWLADRGFFILHRYLSGFMNKEVSLKLISSPAKAILTDEVSIIPEYNNYYEDTIKPELIIVLPGYFSRYIPFLGPQVSFIFLSFFQIAYEKGLIQRKKDIPFSVSAQRIAKYAGMDIRTFQRWVEKESTWEKLSWLVKRTDQKQYFQGADGRPHRQSLTYRISMSLPLTPFDAESLQHWLNEQLSHVLSPIEIIKYALNAPMSSIRPDPTVRQVKNQSFANGPKTVYEIVEQVFGKIESTEMESLTGKLADRYMSVRDHIFVSHYFVKNWIPLLGPGAAWMIILLRELTYYNRTTGEIRDLVNINEGYQQLAHWIGSPRAKTIWEWIREDEFVGQFVTEIPLQDNCGNFETAPRQFKIAVKDPLTPKDEKTLLIPQNSHSNPIGANVMISKGSATINGASVMHSNGADVTISGANDASDGANDIPDGASVASGWRECQCLINTKDSQNTIISVNTDFPNKEICSSNGIDNDTDENRFLTNFLQFYGISLPQTQKIKKSRVFFMALVSWLLYCSSPPGKTISDPLNFALQRLLDDPEKGAGGGFDFLASLPINQILELIRGHPIELAVTDTHWLVVMNGASRNRLNLLVDGLEYIRSTSKHKRLANLEI